MDRQERQGKREMLAKFDDVLTSHVNENVKRIMLIHVSCASSDD